MTRSTKKCLRMVCAFAVSNTGCIALLEKKSGPHIGLLNGIGGKIEPGECPEEAMTREFTEEAGVHISEIGWDMRVELTGHDKSWRVYFFVAKMSDPLFNQITAQEEEPIYIIDDIDSICWEQCVPNLRWIIPYCIQTEVSDILFVQERR